MDIKISKRDGREQIFLKDKIISAIESAFYSVDNRLSDYALLKAKNIADYIEKVALEKAPDILSVEDVQDLVEKGLMSTKRRDVAKAYILYRHERTKARERNSSLIQGVSEKLSANNIQNQNANVDEGSFGGRKGEAANEVMKKYALDYIVSKMSRDNHLNNIIYIHDLDSYALGMHNCLSIPFDDLLANGFNTRQTDVRPANSVNTAFQLVAVIFQLQSLQQFGGVSATHLDWTMVPYVRKSFVKHFCNAMEWVYDDCMGVKPQMYFYTNSSIDLEKTNCPFYKENKKAYDYAMDMTVKEIQQAVEGMYHNLNTLQSRSGNQLPFTSINYGTCTLLEGRMIIKALLDVSLEGVGRLHKTPVFPCGIFQCMKGINRKPDDPNYDLYQLALKSTAKRLYPNYANVDWSGNAGYDLNDPRTYFSTMGCRTANGWDINGFGQLKDGRGNICPVTIILPTLAMMTKEIYEKASAGKYTVTAIVNTAEGPVKIKEFSDVFTPTIDTIFLNILDKKIDEAIQMLIERFDFICAQNPNSAKFMYENGLMAGYNPEEGIRSALKHGTLAVGQIGLAETLQILIGCDHTSEEGMQLAKKIEQLFKDKCAKAKEEHKLNFGVYYSPAENLCYTSMQKFKAKYGEIPNVSDKDFFTNSIHVPVWKEISPFDKIDIESQLTGYSSAGCITYVELDSSVSQNLEALETIVNYAMDKDIPYFAVNVPNDMCLDCGYTDELNDTCPMCGGKKIQRLRRVTGYLTGDYKTAFNLGKQQEAEMRVKHSKQLPNWKH